jgi:uncharacterized membrane protein HdeD (DUF308 family)
MFKNLMTGTWWMLLLRGIIAILFGILAISNVQATALVLFFWFIVFTVTDGIFSIIMSIVYRKERENWWLSLLFGILGILVGLVAVSWPELTALLLLYLIAARALIGGIFEIVMAIKTGKKAQHEWLMILGGVISIILGILMFLQPVLIGLATLWVIGCWAIAVGLFLIIEAFRRKGGGQPAAA